MGRLSRVGCSLSVVLVVVSLVLASCAPTPYPQQLPAQSKVGVHLVFGRRTGWGLFLGRIANAGKHVAVVKALDDFSPLREVKTLMPETLTVGRLNSVRFNGVDYDLQAFRADAYPSAKAAADFYWQLVLPTWIANPQVDVWETFNEYSADWAWQGQFFIEMMMLVDASPSIDFKLSLYNFSSGNPPVNVYGELVPSLQYAKAHGHYLSVHQYGGVSMEVGTLRGTEPFHALRHRHPYEYLSQYNADPPLIISEAGQEAGYTFIGTDRFIEDYAWYDSELYWDSYVVGATAWTLGNYENANFQDALPALADYIIGFTEPPTQTLTPTPEVTLTPTETPTPTLTPTITPTPTPMPYAVYLPFIVKEE